MKCNTAQLLKEIKKLRTALIYHFKAGGSDGRPSYCRNCGRYWEKHWTRYCKVARALGLKETR